MISEGTDLRRHQELMVTESVFNKKLHNHRSLHRSLHSNGLRVMEAVHQECLRIELAEQAIQFRPQFQLKLKYRDHELQSVLVPDFVCYEKIILDIKSVSGLHDTHRTQVIHYLKATV